jgi:hypothetical protein
MKYPQGLYKVLDAALGAVVRPAESIQHLVSTGASVARLLAPARQPISSLMTERSFRRVFEVVDLPQGQLRRAATAMGGTLNDVFVASVVRGLKRYHGLHGVVLNDIRALMPVNVRAKSNTLDGNHFVPARFVVPTGTDASPTDHQSMEARTGSGAERCAGERTQHPASPCGDFSMGFHADR